MMPEPIADWTPDSGIDPYAVRWKATTAMVISDRAAPSGVVLDWVRYNVEVERDEYAPDPAVVVATAPSTDLAAYIAELHNSSLDASGRAPLSAVLHRIEQRLAAPRQQLAFAITRFGRMIEDNGAPRLEQDTRLARIKGRLDKAAQMPVTKTETSRAVSNADAEWLVERVEILQREVDDRVSGEE